MLCMSIDFSSLPSWPPAHRLVVGASSLFPCTMSIICPLPGSLICSLATRVSIDMPMLSQPLFTYDTCPLLPCISSRNSGNILGNNSSIQIGLHHNILPVTCLQRQNRLPYLVSDLKRFFLYPFVVRPFYIQLIFLNSPPIPL
jgi:hypothetical protein